MASGAGLPTAKCIEVCKSLTSWTDGDYSQAESMEEFGFPRGTPVPNIARSNWQFRGDRAKAMGTWVDTACERACSKNGGNGVAKEGIPCLPSTLCMCPLRGSHNLTSHTYEQGVSPSMSLFIHRASYQQTGPRIVRGIGKKIRLWVLSQGVMSQAMARAITTLEVHLFHGCPA